MFQILRINFTHSLWKNSIKAVNYFLENFVDKPVNVYNTLLNKISTVYKNTDFHVKNTQTPHRFQQQKTSIKSL